MSYKNWKEIKFKNDSVKVNGHYYTSVRSVHYNEKDKVVRISWQSDRCSNEEFLNYLIEELPQLKDMKLINTYDEEVEWLSGWRVTKEARGGEPYGSPFSLTILFFE